MKANRSNTIIVAALAITLVVILLSQLVRGPSRQAKTLPDGTVLLLNRVFFGGTNEFTHGKFAERVLGKLIPTKGMKVFSFKLARPTVNKFDCPEGKSQMVVEFKLIGTNAGSHPLVNYRPFEEYRCVIHGETGSEYVQYIGAGVFRKYSDGYFGYVFAGRYPRDSRMLRLHVEHRSKYEDPWKEVAKFEIRNRPQRTTKLWKAEPANTSKKIGELEISLGQVTIVTQSIWGSVVTAPFQVRKNGVLLTNWSASYTRFEDASGNWDYFFGQSLDPRYVWKFDADFEPASDFAPENLLTVSLPKTGLSISTNLMNIPLTISRNWDYLEATIPTNRSDLALRFVCITDEQGREAINPSGSWSQFSFRKGGAVMIQTEQGLTMAHVHLARATIAIVPNVHATFYAQPSLITETNRLPESK
jgi:hypothetical protein